MITPVSIKFLLCFEQAFAGRSTTWQLFLAKFTDLNRLVGDTFVQLRHPVANLLMLKIFSTIYINFLNNPLELFSNPKF